MYSDGDPNVLTAKEYAALREISEDAARREIGVLKEIGKVQAGVRKPYKRLDDTVQMVSAYRFLVS